MVDSGRGTSKSVADLDESPWRRVAINYNVDDPWTENISKLSEQQESTITKKILEVLPHLSTQQTIINGIKDRLKKLGVGNEKDLECITEEDLMKDRLVTRVSAKKLVKSWKSISASPGLYDCFFTACI